MTVGGLELLRAGGLELLCAQIQIAAALLALVAVVQECLDFAGQLSFDLGDWKHLKTTFRRHLGEWLLYLLVEHHVKQPDCVHVPVPFPQSVLRHLAKFPGLSTHKRELKTYPLFDSDPLMLLSLGIRQVLLFDLKHYVHKLPVEYFIRCVLR